MLSWPMRFFLPALVAERPPFRGAPSDLCNGLFCELSRRWASGINRVGDNEAALKFISEAMLPLEFLKDLDSFRLEFCFIDEAFCAKS